MSVVCRQVEVSASGCSLVQRSPTDCGVSECDRESSIKRRPWPTMNCCAMVIQINLMTCVCVRVFVSTCNDLKLCETGLLKQSWPILSKFG